MREDVINKVKELPREPGVYLFKNSQGTIIYVGKAKRLKNRVSSYFQKTISLEPKTKVMVSKISDMEIIRTASELEALILEAELIKKHKPRYNIIYKDDKSHLYIVERKDNLKIGGKVVKLSKVITARKTDLKKNDIKFGPYTNSRTTKQILRTLRKIFPFRDCSPAKFYRYQKIDKPCLYGHLGLCPAPCLSGADLEKSKKELIRLKKFLRGKSSSIINEYEKLMAEAAKHKDYEQAADYRDMLRRFEYIRASFKPAQQYMENPNLFQDMAQRSLRELRDSIPILDKLPVKIECYDISNISGHEAVGSLVVSKNGSLNSDEYKKFRIKLKSEPDDVGMMAEVLSRRLKNKKWELPDLIVLDGGKGQVSAIEAVLKDNGLKIPLVGLAKRKETLIFLQGGEFMKLQLPEDNEGLKLIIRLRDEAHRFAQSYHHYLRRKKIQV